MTATTAEFFTTLAAVDIDNYKELRAVLKEARDIGLPVECKLNAKREVLAAAYLELLDYYEDEVLTTTTTTTTAKARFLAACNNAPRPGCLEQRPDERIDALVTDEEGAGYDSHVYAAAPTAQPLVEPETVDVQAVEVTEDETDILAVYLLAAAWAVGALCLALVVSVIFVSKMAFTGLVAGVRAYHDLCFQLGTKWGEYEMMAVRVPSIV